MLFLFYLFICIFFLNEKTKSLLKSLNDYKTFNSKIWNNKTLAIDFPYSYAYIVHCWSDLKWYLLFSWKDGEECCPNDLFIGSTSSMEGGSAIRQYYCSMHYVTKSYYKLLNSMYFFKMLFDIKIFLCNSNILWVPSLHLNQ